VLELTDRYERPDGSIGLRARLGERARCTSRSFDANPASAAMVRNYVRDSLSPWNVSSDTAMFIANELATNAIVHAHSAFLVEVSLDERTCRIAVVDHDPEPPRMERVRQSSPHGRGLTLVNALSSSWGVETREDGKAVWCDIAVTSSDR